MADKDFKINLNYQTERPGAVYLAASLAGHTMKGLPAFGIYGHDVQDIGDMPLTISRVNLVKGLGPVLQIAEGWTVELPEKVNKILSDRTDPTTGHVRSMEHYTNK